MEIWKTAIQDDRYEVSNLGKIRRKGKQDCLKINYNATGGYGRVSIGRVHTIVAYSFLGERPKGLDINHIDGNKKNNNSDNLEYVNKSENCKQACNIQGLRNLKRENHNRAKLTESDVIEIKNLIKNKVKNKEIAQMFSVDASLISHIKRGAKWN